MRSPTRSGAAKREIRIVLVDWMGYPWERTKVYGSNVVPCGLAPLLDAMASHEAGAAFRCRLVINRAVRRKANLPTKEAYRDLAGRYPFIDALDIRSNRGLDLGAYDYGLKALRAGDYRGDVMFLNTSVRGPKEDGWLARYRDLFHGRPGVGLCGITLNTHDTNCDPPPFAPHVQSFCLYTSSEVLDRVFPKALPGAKLRDKLKLIRLGELEISRRVLEAGYGICGRAFPGFVYHRGSTWAIPEGDVRFLPEYAHVANQL